MNIHQSLKVKQPIQNVNFRTQKLIMSTLKEICHEQLQQIDSILGAQLADVTSP